MRRVLSILALAALPLAAGDLPLSVVMLARIRAHVRETVDRLPDCTCLENVARFHQLPGKDLKPVDSVVLQILFTGDKELFAAPGDTHWDPDVTSVLSEGLMGNGFFALHLRSIFLNDQSIITYHGLEDVDGLPEARYDFSISRMMSGYHISSGTGSAVVATGGSFWADPATYDVHRIEFHAEDIPPEVAVSEVYTRIDYERVRVGQLDVLLPQTAELRTVHPAGEQSDNRIEFTHCQGFHTESTLSFSPGVPLPPNSAPALVLPAARPEQTLAAGLRIPVALTRALDHHTAVGALLEGKIAADVLDKKKLVLPAGAVVTGRVRRFARQFDSFPYFVLAIEFTRIEQPGQEMRFYADLVQIDTPFGGDISMAFLRFKSALDSNSPDAGRVVTITTKPLPGVGTLFIRGDHFLLPPGFKTVWKTRPFPQAANQ